MGCISAKAQLQQKDLFVKGSKTEYNRQVEILIVDLVNAMDQIDEIKRQFKSINDNDDIVSSIDTQEKLDDGYLIETCLLQFYQSGRLSKDELQMMYIRTQSVFKIVNILLGQCSEILNQCRENKLEQQLVQVLKGFVSVFQETTARILAMPAVSFDTFHAYKIGKRITSSDSNSIIM